MEEKEPEVWKSIEGYEGLYEVSNLGRVKSLPREWITGQHGHIVRTNEKILKPVLHNSKEAYFYSLRGKTILAHNLVAKAFLNKTSEFIIHIDKDISNNMVSNLKLLSEEQFKEYCKQNAIKNNLGKKPSRKSYYALIQDGLVSGKPDFICNIFTDREQARKKAKQLHFKQKQIISITKDEYDYINSIPECFDVGYFKEGKTLKEKFYY